jgi:hypothetical protein
MPGAGVLPAGIPTSGHSMTRSPLATAVFTAIITACLSASPCLAGTADPIVAVNTDLREVKALQALTIAGHIDKFAADKDVVLEGWGRLSSGDGNGGMIRLDTDLPIAQIEVETVPRPDVVAVVGDPGLALSGFRIRLILEPAGIPVGYTLCVSTEDPLYGHFRMHDNPKVPCPARP